MFLTVERKPDCYYLTLYMKARIIMTQTNKGLKASKAKAHSPSQAEVVLTDKQKLSTVALIEAGVIAINNEANFEGAKLLRDKSANEFASIVVNYVKDNALDYQSMQAVKKHIVNGIALSTGNTDKYITEYLNKAIKNYVASADLKGFTMPKAESKSAVSMSKARAELAQLTNADLQAKVNQAKGSTDYSVLANVAKYAKELSKREQAKAKELEKASKDNLKGLKKTLTDWLKPMGADDVAVMLYVKHNFEAIAKQAKQAK